MTLSTLLGVRPGITALVGSGGKTTAMYVLARELAEKGRVVCCTTTHIFPPGHIPILDAPSGQALSEALARHGCVCAGAPAPGGKLTAPALPIPRLAALADYVLVEADGSKMLPMKAHLPHEPAIPPETSQTVVLVGGAGFGQPARAVVHRLERFCQLAGIGPDDPVTAGAAAAVLAYERLGGQVFVNQAEGCAAREASRRLARLLDLPVFAGSLRQGCWERLAR